jgi:hypothetical protein
MYDMVTPYGNVTYERIGGGQSPSTQQFAQATQDTLSQRPGYDAPGTTNVNYGDDGGYQQQPTQPIPTAQPQAVDIPRYRITQSLSEPLQGISDSRTNMQRNFLKDPRFVAGMERLLYGNR